MAAVIPEAAEAVSSGTGAVEGASASARARAGGRAPRVAAGASGGQRRRGEAPRGGQQRERQFKKSAKKTGKGALKARLPGSHTYQPVILAEFVVAIVIVSVSPVAKGGTAESVAKGSPSPYSVNTLKQLVAIGGAYFILALLASSRRMGRYAAWFGGLILLGLGFAELANGDLTALFKVFGPSSGAATPSSILGTSVVPGSVPADIQNAAQNALNPAFYAPVPDATGIFPVINPSVTQTGPLPGITQGPPPGVAANPNATAVTISPPPGGSGVITT